MNRLYGGAKSNLADRGSIMLDLYLNTPDKGSNETPLHFASKLGAIEVVRVLVTYEQCDRHRRNKYGDTAKDLVCSRASGMAADAGIKKEILFALEDQYYVAVLRSPDNTLNPTIAQPFCPTSPPPFLEGSTPKKSNEPPMIVSGVAGPMTASDATIFRKKWKTPPRKLVLDTASASPIVTDPEKGLERVGRALATDFNVPWKEYWAFLGEFLDISSPEGLQKLENHLKVTSMYSSKKDTPEKPPALPEPVVSPITDLCNNFKTLVINDPRPKVSPHCLVHSSTVYATRLALSLTRGLLPSIQEIDKYQYFLEGCSKDSRFSQEDLSTAHSRLATLVYSRLCSSKNDNSDFINSVLDEKTDNCSKRSSNA
uniref:Ankyrin repeat and LEM domain-containing protein 2 n=1 Tax=Lygus hesperus TaxID=30085 RepID=A0A0A9X915_LYGHE